MATHKIPKNPKKYSCEFCNHFTYNLKDFNRHLLTQKHIRNTSATFSNINATQKSQHYICCNCNKEYRDRSGLWRHKKSCLTQDNIDSEIDEEFNNKNTNEDDDISTKQLVLLMLKQNNKVQDALIEMSKQISTTNNNNTTNNNTMHNNFNLNVFLNEQCKDALNISDFIDSLKITLEDLLFSKTNGISRGITDVMIKGLKELDINKRPIHCTDIKRDIMYIKDEDKWQKDENHEMMKNTIVKIADKERTALQKWAIDNPDWIETERKQIEYLTMMRSICEPIENYTNYERKIIKNIGKEIQIDKKI
jgi:hypothetical protein